MPFYALATVPLITKLSHSVDQTWYADDAAATGNISSLRSWWDDIATHGPSFGYFANASKTWLVVKPTFRDKAYAAYTHGMVSKWSYISRTIPDITEHLQILENTIRTDLYHLSQADHHQTTSLET
jgi:hypothetical protein